MFQLSNTPIDSASLQSQIADSRAGALVVFEGRVRNHNQQKAVTQLEYEAANEALLRNEFAKIENEALATFEILNVTCVHRVGILEIGDMAVWIGVISAHRGPAFDACEYVIDELKKRLAIFKKEHYISDDSGWIESP